MSDSYTESFEIEIEREKLCRYWRRQWTFMAMMPCLGLGGFFGLAFSLGGPKDRQNFEFVMEVVIAVATGLGIGLATGIFVLALIYFVFLHRTAKKEADAIHVSVEGAYLRIREGVSSIKDRKLHFRAIIDYAYFQDSLMRECEIGGIELNTIGRGQDATVRLRGVKNALEVRDMLSEIDRQRENT